MSPLFNIPFFGIDRMFKEHSAEIMDCVSSVYKSGKVLMGPEVDEFEVQLASLCQRKYAISVGSCTDALYFSLLCSGIRPGDEIIVTSFSFIASVSPILRIGAIPVFTDTDPSSCQMNIHDIENKITSKTKAILGVHLFGAMLDIEKLEAIAKKHKLILIEDAAQSLGAGISNRKAGSMGDISCLSFDPTKIIGAFGNGGMVLTDNPDFFDQLKKLRYHGKSVKGNDFEILGFNSRIATSQASIMLYELKQLKNWIDKRNKVARFYLDHLKNNLQIILPEYPQSGIHCFHKFVIKCDKRNELKGYLENKGIQTMIHYPKALFEYELFKQYPFKAENISHTHELKTKVLSLPVYPELSENEIDYICKSIIEFTEQC